MNNVTVRFNIIKRETEKAILVSFDSCDRAGNPRQFDAWMPKSQAKVSGDAITIPAWLANEKLPAIIAIISRIA